MSKLLGIKPGQVWETAGRGRVVIVEKWGGGWEVTSYSDPRDNDYAINGDGRVPTYSWAAGTGDLVKKVDNLEVPVLQLKSLNYNGIMVKGTLYIGCQAISRADLQQAAKFLAEHAPARSPARSSVKLAKAKRKKGRAVKKKKS